MFHFIPKLTACSGRACVAVIAASMGLMSAGAAEAHHSWKCPPVTAAKVVGVGDKGYSIEIGARNTCGCKIRLRVCPKDRDGCEEAWIEPGDTWSTTVKTGADSDKLDWDWGTHSNDAPCY